MDQYKNGGKKGKYGEGLPHLRNLIIRFFPYSYTWSFILFIALHRLQIRGCYKYLKIMQMIKLILSAQKQKIIFDFTFKENLHKVFCEVNYFPHSYINIFISMKNYF